MVEAQAKVCKVATTCDKGTSCNDHLPPWWYQQLAVAIAGGPDRSSCHHGRQLMVTSSLNGEIVSRLM
jgi:hypothetical protein